MRRHLRIPSLPACLAMLAAVSCGGGAAPRGEDVIPPPAEVPAPDRLSQPNVPEVPAPAPTAPGTYASMTPPSTQHTPPRPSTRSPANPEVLKRPDSTYVSPEVAPATPPQAAPQPVPGEPSVPVQPRHRRRRSRARA